MALTKFAGLCVIVVVCDDCNTEYEGDCPVHGPLVIIKDTEASIVYSLKHYI